MIPYVLHSDLFYIWHCCKSIEISDLQLAYLCTEGYQIIHYFSQVRDYSHAVLLCPDKRQT